MRLYYVPTGKGILIPSKRGHMRPSGGSILSGKSIYEKQPVDREPAQLAQAVTGAGVQSVKLTGGQTPVFDMSGLRRALIDTKPKKKIRL